ncbi:kinase domain protein, putative (macronuclear) [Tetrahymena thermophila SB210]|uniref:Kinase domain protein, putative n=1 Tax=Tetrahymena thermophila (strain SB210) TaxID=312017 RepID=I7M0N0_TETTS|nr:kinase domain protein, putative [Tetrahymena thermophila SB210]EAR89905.2 kinase domain protein, putative [Tetrahymena thermophila SB210]|eukprot:XP_001010150.2 kinase domain protein, putative [Tetrahymena thermophila SB210]
MSQKKQKIFLGLRRFYSSYFDRHVVLVIDLSNHRVGNNSLIGKRLSKCENVQYLTLNLDKSQLKAVGTQKLCDGIIKCSKLISLNINLSCNKILDEGVSSLGACIKSISNLTELILDLTLNHIGTKGGNDIVAAITSCQNLKKLTLIANCNRYWDQEDFKLLGSFIAKNQNLYSVILSFFNCWFFRHWEYMDLATIIERKDLQNLDINFSSSSKKIKNHPCFIPPTIPCQSNLLSLRLYLGKNYNIEKDFKQNFFSALAKCVNLIYLEFEIRFCGDTVEAQQKCRSQILKIKRLVQKTVFIQIQ